MSLQIPENALVVVVDGAEARWFTNDGGRDGVTLRQHARTEVQNVDDEGPAGKVPPRTAESELDEFTFAKQVAQALNEGALKHRYDHLVLVADPTTLGRIRPLLHKETQQRLVGDVAKDLTNLPLEDIQRALS
ncbi:host attachment family protein [Xanthomonas sp. NCPPB 2654]|uniref:host attachment family protein n=1 Tax=unclassified Xanthomonas TaxID=2643310 RepID=UPI0021DF46B7|nr:MULTISPECIES: host attachment family protein [unclassified Xanthomonas]MDL5365844.1 host attachment family protein [Xanthomonas sp. NCPPB 2654]UYC20583.1 host attachment family protein [Xanthomonas sp. CFBP 8443]